MIDDKNQGSNRRDGHIVVLTGATFQGSGVNFYILNNAIQWKKMGLRVTVICQDRNADKMPQVDSYILGELPPTAPKLHPGQLRVVIPDINNLIPIYASYQYCQFPGIKSKAVQQMTDEEIETNIAMTIPCLRAVCAHDRPFKVIANYMLLSGIIAAKGLAGLGIPYDIIVPGPALVYSVKPYPHLWKWVLPGFKKANFIFQHTQYVKTQFLKCFINQIQQYKMDVKVKAIPAGMNPNVVNIPQNYNKAQQQFLQNLKQKITDKKKPPATTPNPHPTLTTPQQLHQSLTKSTKSKNSNQIDQNFLHNWLPFSEQDETVLYVGALINNKGMGELLAIAPKLIAKRPTLKFIFCGSGPYKEHMYRLMEAFQSGDFQLAKLVCDAGQFITEVNIQDHFFKIDQKIRNRIIFAGLLDQQLIYNLLPLCTLYLVPSKIQQSISMGVVQAMCCGLTPICNDHSWMNEVLNVVERGYPELAEVVRVERSQFFEQLPETIVRALDFVAVGCGVGKLEYRRRIRDIAVGYFSWRNTATILAEQRQFSQYP